MARDLAGRPCAPPRGGRRRLAGCEFGVAMPPRPAGGAGSWLPVIQIQSAPPMSCGASSHLAARASRPAPSPSWKLSPRQTRCAADSARQHDRPGARKVVRGCRRAAAACRAAAKRSLSPDADRRRRASPSPANRARRSRSASKIGAAEFEGEPSPRRRSRHGLARSVRAPPRRAARRRRRHRPLRPISSSTGTASGETRSSRRCTMRPLARPACRRARLEIGQPARRVLAGRAQQHMVGSWRAQHVVDQVRVEGDLAAGLLLAGIAALDQPGDDRDVAEGALEHGRFGHPLLEIVAQHVLVEQLRDVCRRLQAPDRDDVVGGDEAQRRRPARSMRLVSSMPSVWCALRPSKQ